MSPDDENVLTYYDQPVPFWIEEQAVIALEDGLSAYLMRLYESIDDESVDPTTLSGLPFCGCDVCQTRETLVYLVPSILLIQRAGEAGLKA